MIILVTKEKVYYSLQFWKTVLYTSWTISLWYNIKRERERERERVEVAPIVEKMVESRLRCFEHAVKRLVNYEERK
jgi:truncated hemoglobin YjbI